MTRTVSLLVAAMVLAAVSLVGAQIPLNDVTVIGSPDRVLHFAHPATLDRLSLVPGGMRLQVSHATAWPSVPVEAGGEPAQIATLWIFVQIEGRWYATGAERLRPGQIAGDTKPEDPNVDHFIGVSWLYDANRWGPMAGYTPKVGELVGAMVVAGSTRSDDNTPVEERTAVVAFPWPGAAGADPVTVIWTEPVSSTPGPTPAPTPPPAPGPDLSALLERVSVLEGAIEALRSQVSGVTLRLSMAETNAAALTARVMGTGCAASVLRIPVSCRLTIPAP